MKKINEEFGCLHCGFSVPKAQQTCRNHCTKCLFSMHVDKETPGDRESDCHGLMAPIAIDKSGKKGLMIFHKCLECGYISKNKVADDDDMEEVINLSANPLPEMKKQ
ncbi:MAG TPA: RNHCP domain-containing protein [Candidatus Gracilibacteria bacterium]|nr:RNHCP domain-containing protein [Candidatus Gracilibacteria bacterium]